MSTKPNNARTTPMTTSNRPNCSIASIIVENSAADCADYMETPGLTSQTRNFGLHFKPVEEVRNLECGGVRSIGAVDGIALDVGSELLADGSGIGFGGVCRPHHFPEFLDSIVSLEHHGDNRSLRHELHETSKERSILVNIIESLGLRLGQMKHFQCAYPEPGLLDFTENSSCV